MTRFILWTSTAASIQVRYTLYRHSLPDPSNIISPDPPLTSSANWRSGGRSEPFPSSLPVSVSPFPSDHSLSSVAKKKRSGNSPYPTASPSLYIKNGPRCSNRREAGGRSSSSLSSGHHPCIDDKSLWSGDSDRLRSDR